MIERYVRLGDELDEQEGIPGKDVQGRFADITKSADITMEREALPLRLCIRDTPGVNDTFMMREQITIRAIRDSRICVVVLSAHQALSSTDMALIRLIAHVKSREVNIFVNRVDELSDPAKQIPQIRESISATLKRHNGPEDVEVIFGSALWALYAFDMRLRELPPASTAALHSWSSVTSASSVERPNGPGLTEFETWRVSGIPELQAAIGERIMKGAGATLLQKVGASGHNLTGGLAAARQISVRKVPYSNSGRLHPDCAKDEMQLIMSEQATALNQQIDELISDFCDRIERVQESFLERATASLIVHLEKFGELTPWTYDPAGLRVLLSAAHKVLSRKSQSTFEANSKTTVERLARLYHDAFALGPQDIEIAPPRAPQVASPVILGRTIALDLQASWWKRWWLQRRGYKAYAKNFHELIKTETNPVILERRDDVAINMKSDARTALDTLLQEQFSIFETLEKMQRASPEDLRAYVAGNTSSEREELLRGTMQTLSDYATI